MRLDKGIESKFSDRGTNGLTVMPSLYHDVWNCTSRWFTIVHLRQRAGGRWSIYCKRNQRFHIWALMSVFEWKHASRFQ